jgi:hypothetical protein
MKYSSVNKLKIGDIFFEDVYNEIWLVLDVKLNVVSAKVIKYRLGNKHDNDCSLNSVKEFKTNKGIILE